MKIREENCNMALLAAVTLFAVVIASGASLVPSSEALVRMADREIVRPAAPASEPVRYVGDEPAVRVVGSPFMPNTNPRER